MDAAANKTYTPRKPWENNPIHRLLTDHLEDFLLTRPTDFAPDRKMAAHRLRSINAFLKCGDPRAGYTKLRCRVHGLRRIVPFSCAVGCLCNSCDAKRAMLMADHLARNKLVQGNWRTLTVTIPKRLRKFFRTRRHGVRIFFQLVKQSLALYLKQKGYDPKTVFVSAFAVYQAFGAFLNFHPHLHAVLKDALYTSDDREIDHRFAIDLLSQCVRETFLKRLAREGYLTETDRDDMLTWEHSGFNVHLTDVIPPDRMAAVIRYMLRAPYDTSRFRYDGNRLVITPPKGSDRPTEILPAGEAVARIVSLIPPPRIHRTRAWGILAHRVRFKAAEHPQTTTAQRRRRRPRYRDFLQRFVRVDPNRCDICDDELHGQVVDDDVAAHASLDAVPLPTHRLICFDLDDWLRGGECPQPYISTGEMDEVDPPPTDFDIVDDVPEDDVPLILVDNVAKADVPPIRLPAKTPASKSLAARDPPTECQDKTTNRRALLESLRKQADKILAGSRSRRSAKGEGEASSKNRS